MKIETFFWKTYLCFFALVSIAAFVLFSLKGFFWFFIGAFFLGAEFKLLTLMAALMVGKQKANVTGKALIFILKLVVWLLILSSPMILPIEARKPVALSCFVFFMTLIALSFRTWGWPKIEHDR